MRAIVLTAAALCALAAPVLAQQPVAGVEPVPMPASYRETQLKMLELQRRLLLAMADSMPEPLYRDKATPAQRDFASQLHHCAAAVAMIGSRFFGVAAPQLPDTAAVLNTRAGMRAYVNGVYDWAGATLRAQSDQDRAVVIRFFSTQVPRWQVWDEVHQHTWWTAGQVVANFRKHGMAPPGFGFF
jgi:hypothetical protein